MKSSFASLANNCSPFKTFVKTAWTASSLSKLWRTKAGKNDWIRGFCSHCFYNTTTLDVAAVLGVVNVFAVSFFSSMHLEHCFRTFQGLWANVSWCMFLQNGTSSDSWVRTYSSCSVFSRCILPPLCHGWLWLLPWRSFEVSRVWKNCFWVDLVHFNIILSILKFGRKIKFFWIFGLKTIENLLNNTFQASNRVQKCIFIPFPYFFEKSVKFR